MRHKIALGLLAAAALAAAPVSPQAEKSQVAKMTLKVGDAAPEFTLLSDQWKTVKLSDYRGKKKCLSRRLRPGLHRRLNQAASGGPGWNRLQKD